MIFEGIARFEIDSDAILNRLPLKGDEVVILSGTIVEGIGNAHSDYDVYVISDRRPSVDPSTPHNYLGVEGGEMNQFYDYLNAEGLAFDVEFWTNDDVAAAFEELNSLYERASEKTKIFRPNLGWQTEDFLHKLAIGMPLTSDQGFGELKKKFSKSKFNFVKYRNFTGGYPEWKDIAGAWMSGDIDTALHDMRMYLNEQLQGLSQLSGNSNYKPKWVMQNLRRLEKAHGELVGDIREWLYRGNLSSETRKQSVLDGADLVDRIFRAGRKYLDSVPEFYSVDTALSLTEAEFRTEQIFDEQTKVEFEHRRRIFSDEASPLRTHLTGGVKEILKNSIFA